MFKFSGRRRVAILTAVAVGAVGLVGITQMSSANAAQSYKGCLKFKKVAKDGKEYPAFYPNSAAVKKGPAGLKFCDKHLNETGGVPRSGDTTAKRDYTESQRPTTKPGTMGNPTKKPAAPAGKAPAPAPSGANVKKTQDMAKSHYDKFVREFGEFGKSGGKRTGGSACPSGTVRNPDDKSRCVTAPWDDFLKGFAAQSPETQKDLARNSGFAEKISRPKTGGVGRGVGSKPTYGDCPKKNYNPDGAYCYLVPSAQFD